MVGIVKSGAVLRYWTQADVYRAIGISQTGWLLWIKAGYFLPPTHRVNGKRRLLYSDDEANAIITAGRVMRSK